MVDFSGKFVVQGASTEIYEFLTDPSRLLKCLPDCKQYDIQDREHFNVTVRVGFGKIRALVNLAIEMQGKNDGDNIISAKGRLLNSVINVEGKFNVTPATEMSTFIKWTARANIGNYLMQNIGGYVDQVIQEYIARFVKAIEAELSVSNSVNN